jgi:hypothetical protein
MQHRNILLKPIMTITVRVESFCCEIPMICKQMGIVQDRTIHGAELITEIVESDCQSGVLSPGGGAVLEEQTNNR